MDRNTLSAAALRDVALCSISLGRKAFPRNINNGIADGRDMIGGPDGQMEPLEWAKFVIRNKAEDDYSAALSILSSKADQGVSDAEFYLGLVYARGQGIGRDFTLARKWLQRAADKENMNAAYFLAKIYLRGYGIDADPVKAAALFERCAEDGDIRAMYELGLLYMDGNGVSRDLGKTFNLMLDSANGGHKEAQFVLGQLYKTGAGTDQDSREAVQIAQVFLGDFKTRLVTRIVIQHRPHML